MKRLLFVIGVAVLLSLLGCGNDGDKPGAAMSVAITPTSAFTIAEGQTRAITATVSNDSSNKGVTWALSGAACSGAACGTLTNTTTTSATYNTPAGLTANLTVTVTATSIADTSKSAPVSVTVVPLPSITVNSLPAGAVGTSYSASVTASGGISALTYSISTGALPAGLTLNSSTGAITGTPTSSGTFNFTAQVADSSTPPLTATKALSITVNPAPLAVTTTALPSGVALSAYSANVASSGGTPPVNWTVTAGALPDGLALNATTGAISGMPVTAGTFDFTVTATDSASPAVTASKALSIVVQAALSISTDSLPDGSVNTAYTATLVSSGGTAAVAWSVSAGSLPTGLTLNGSTGVISGTPTSAGTADFTITATDSSTPPRLVEAFLSINIAVAPLAISNTSLPSGTIGTAYTATLEAVGGTLPITWSISAGSLPAWATLDSNSGEISGTPTGSPATTSFTVTATDSGLPVQTQSKSLSITTVAGGVNTAELNGHYAFALRGFEFSDGTMVTMAGSFVADGAGTISGGIMDLVTSSGTTQLSQVISSGFYSVGVDHRGTLSLTTSQGTNTFAFALGSITSGVSSQGTIITANSKVAAGMLKKQDTAVFTTASFNGKYAFGMGGMIPTGRFAAAGILTMDGTGGFSAALDFNEAGNFVQDAFSGNYEFSDATYGRGTLTDTTNGSHMAVYVVSSSEVFVIHVDGFATSGQVFTGRALKQTVATFAASSMQGVSVVHETGLKSDGTTKVSLAFVTSDGAGSATYAFDKNSSGTMSSGTTNITYTVASNGRVSIAGTGVPVIYLVSAGTGFLIGSEEDASEGFVELQSGGLFTNASVSGSYIFGTAAPAALASAVSSGVVTADGAGHLSGTSDFNGGGDPLGTDSFTEAYSVAASGRVTGLSSMLFYIISPTKAVMIDTTSTHPGVTVVHK